MMEAYFRILDLLFQSNYKIVNPTALRNIMKNHLGCNYDLLEAPDYVIDIWKQNQDPKKLSKTAQRALEIL